MYAFSIKTTNFLMKMYLVFHKKPLKVYKIHRILSKIHVFPIILIEKIHDFQDKMYAISIKTTNFLMKMYLVFHKKPLKVHKIHRILSKIHRILSKIHVFPTKRHTLLRKDMHFKQKVIHFRPEVYTVLQKSIHFHEKYIHFLRKCMLFVEVYTLPVGSVYTFEESIHFRRKCIHFRSEVYTLWKKAYTSGRKCIHFRPEVYTLPEKVYTLTAGSVYTFSGSVYTSGSFMPKVYIHLEEPTRAHAQFYLLPYVCLYKYIHILYTYFCRETQKIHKFINKKR